MADSPVMSPGDPFTSAIDSLISSDRQLASVVAEHGRPERFSRPATFQTLVLLILEQQVSLDSARAAFDRLEAAIPGVRPDGAGRHHPVGTAIPGVHPDAVLELTDEELRSIGFSRQKARYARELAHHVIDGRLKPERLDVLDDEAVRRELIAVPGIGPWTADVFLMASLDRTDIWPVGDRALQVATAEALGLSTVPNQVVLAEIGERWRPHRTAAAQILWHGYLSTRKRTIPGST